LKLEAQINLFKDVNTILELEGLKPIPNHLETIEKYSPVEDKTLILEQTDLKPYTMPENKMRIIEAALFMSGQPLHPKDLGKLVGLRADGKILRMMKTLADEYNQNKESAIEIAMEKSGHWTMRVKKDYAPAVRTFSSEAEISKHAIKTLAYIYRNEGITKRTLFNRLGGSIYEDCSELEEKGFVITEPFGRTKKLYITPKFKHYFGV
jgi:segregation and condensation protein B